MTNLSHYKLETKLRHISKSHAAKCSCQRRCGNYQSITTAASLLRYSPSFAGRVINHNVAIRRVPLLQYNPHISRLRLQIIRVSPRRERLNEKGPNGSWRDAVIIRERLAARQLCLNQTLDGRNVHTRKQPNDRS